MRTSVVGLVTDARRVSGQYGRTYSRSSVWLPTHVELAGSTDGRTVGRWSGYGRTSLVSGQYKRTPTCNVGVGYIVFLFCLRRYLFM